MENFAYDPTNPNHIVYALILIIIASAFIMWSWRKVIQNLSSSKFNKDRFMEAFVTYLVFNLLFGLPWLFCYVMAIIIYRRNRSELTVSAVSQPKIDFQSKMIG